MLVSDLVKQLQQDMGDPEGLDFLEDECVRALTRGVSRINLDLGSSYVISNDELLPEPSSGHYELLMIACQGFLAGMRRAYSASSGIVFQSGDKKVDKSKVSVSWGGLFDTLWKQYKQLLCKLTGQPLDDDIIVPTGPDMVIYEQGSDV